MSYDIDVVITRTIHSENYTSNVADMYYHAWDQIKNKLNIPDIRINPPFFWQIISPAGSGLHLLLKIGDFKHFGRINLNLIVS